MWGPGKEMMKAYEKSRNQLNKRKTLKENLDYSRAPKNQIISKKVSEIERKRLESKFKKEHKEHIKRSRTLVISLTAVIIVIGYVYIFQYL